MAPVRSVPLIFFNLMMRALTGLPYQDTQCGFKLFRADAAREIFSRQRLEGFGFDVEVLYIATTWATTVSKSQCAGAMWPERK